MNVSDAKEPESDITPAPIQNAMTVDVEDYYQVSAFDSTVDRKDWDQYPQRVVRNTEVLLDMFARHQIHATFFTLGWVANKYPGLIRKIVADGHELASHGWNHWMITKLTPDQFREDVKRARDTLQAVSGEPVVGYRAPSYSINRQTAWAHDILIAEGYRYSSSIAPIRHTLYGFPDAPRFRHQRGNANGAGITELPVSTVQFAGKNFPCGGGGWFRLYPYWLSKRALQQINQKDKQPTIFYIHPWEIDPDQPKIRNVSLSTKFRHYQSLDRTEARLEKLLKDFSWSTMSRTFELQHAA